ncbi:MAG: trigger factor [Armatimonadota bacterium]
MNAEDTQGTAAEPEQAPEPQEATAPGLDGEAQGAAATPEAQPAGAAQSPQGLAMKVEVQRLPASRAALRIEVDSSEVDRTYRRVYRQLSRSGRIKGFRPGKAPKDIIKLQVGEEAVAEYVLNELRPRAFEQALGESGIIPLNEAPELSEPQLAEGQPLTFTATLTVRPEPQLGPYKGLKLQRPVTEITEEDVQEELDELLEQAAVYEEVDRDEVQEGDLVILDLAVAVGQEQPDSRRDVEYLVGEGSRDPEIDEHLVGARKGETQTVEATYNEDYPEPELAGAQAQVTFTVKEIREKRRPEPTDEFVKENYGFDSLGELREDIKERLASNARERAEQELRRQAIEQVTEASQVEVPESMVAAEAEEREQDAALGAAQLGLSYDDFLRVAGRTKEQAQEEHRRAAREGLARALVLDAVAEAEGIRATAEELEAEIARIAARQDQPMEPTAVRQVLTETGQLSVVRNRLQNDKVVEFLLEHAEIEEVPLDDYLAAANAADQDSEGEGSASE